MKKSYPWYTLGLGLIFTLLIIQFGPDSAQGFKLPLLTALLMNELGLIITAVGVYLSFKEIKEKREKQRNLALLLGNLFLLINFVRVGIVLWPASS